MKKTASEGEIASVSRSWLTPLKHELRFVRFPISFDFFSVICLMHCLNSAVLLRVFKVIDFYRYRFVKPFFTMNIISDFEQNTRFVMNTRLADSAENRKQAIVISLCIQCSYNAGIYFLRVSTY